jgi:hypothetical protein
MVLEGVQIWSSSSVELFLAAAPSPTSPPQGPLFVEALPLPRPLPPVADAPSRPTPPGAPLPCGWAEASMQQAEALPLHRLASALTALSGMQRAARWTASIPST